MRPLLLVAFIFSHEPTSRGLAFLTKLTGSRDTAACSNWLGWTTNRLDLIFPSPFRFSRSFSRRLVEAWGEPSTRRDALSWKKKRKRKKPSFLSVLFDFFANLDERERRPLHLRTRASFHVHVLVCVRVYAHRADYRVGVHTRKYYSRPTRSVVIVAPKQLLSLPPPLLCLSLSFFPTEFSRVRVSRAFRKLHQPYEEA